jgi:hypothetical protein
VPSWDRAEGEAVVRCRDHRRRDRPLAALDYYTLPTFSPTERHLRSSSASGRSRSLSPWRIGGVEHPDADYSNIEPLERFIRLHAEPDGRLR